MAYDNSNKDSAEERVIDQHRRVLEAGEELCKPNKVFQEDLVQKVLQWKRSGSNVVLCGNFNQDVYTDKLVKRLLEPGNGMKEQVFKPSGLKFFTNT